MTYIHVEIQCTYIHVVITRYCHVVWLYIVTHFKWLRA